MKHIFLIGGAGYIGTVLANYFLNKNFKVTILDNFIYNNQFAINTIKNHKNFNCINGNFGDLKLLSNSAHDADYVVFLGGLVGDPITKKYPEESLKINEELAEKSINFFLNQKIDKLIFISTCSNYGIQNGNNLADEESELKPLSLYAKSKVKIEKFILSKKNYSKSNATILRFATAFGLSKRMRFDLTVNQFTLESFAKNKLLVYDSDTWRPYCHVLDFASLIEKVIEAPNILTSFEVFNAGGNKNNHRKIDIVEKIKKYNTTLNVEFKDNGSDMRNYNVNFNKVKEILNFEPSYSVEDGIIETINELKKNNFNDFETNKNKYGNYIINYNE